MSGNVADPRFFDHDPLTGLTEYFLFDPETDGFSIQTQQDVEPHLELNQFAYNNAPLRFGELTHVAHIPSVIVMELAKQGIMSPGGAILDEPRFRKFLNDRDTRAFRTRPGVV